MTGQRHQPLRGPGRTASYDDGDSTRRRRVRDFLKSRPSRVWQVLAAIIALVLFAWTWWKLPPVLYRHVSDDATRVKAITDTRTALLAGLVGLGAIGTFWLNGRVYKITARTLQLTEQGHVTERYTKAIEQLGAPRLDVRLGGIYALERIAVDSDRDHPTIVDVLSAFVREHSNPVRRGRRRTLVARDHSRPTEDVQAAATVLGRLPTRKGVVTRAHLAGANLSGALLGWADLSGADFRQATLSGADFGGATLTGALLGGADLTGAYLYRADLSGADLRQATLTSAHLYKASLTGTLLYGTNLCEARDVMQYQLDSADGDAQTQLPEGLHSPSSWADE